MDDVIFAVQDAPKHQQRVFYGTVRSLKWLFPSLPGDSKDLVSVKTLLAGEGDWTCAKEVLGLTVDTKAGTVSLPKRKIWELLTFVDILETQCRMVQKDLKRLVEKLRYINLPVPGAVALLYHIQHALA